MELTTKHLSIKTDDEFPGLFKNVLTITRFLSFTNLGFEIWQNFEWIINKIRSNHSSQICKVDFCNCSLTKLDSIKLLGPENKTAAIS